MEAISLINNRSRRIGNFKARTPLFERAELLVQSITAILLFYSDAGEAGAAGESLTLSFNNASALLSARQGTVFAISKTTSSLTTSMCILSK